MEHTSAFTSIIDSQLLPMRVGIVFLMGCCILAAYCTNKRKNIEKKEYRKYYIVKYIDHNFNLHYSNKYKPEDLRRLTFISPLKIK